MSSVVSKNGCPNIDELKKFGCLPDDARYLKGPVAILECIQEIPCNPCANACPYGAIYVGEPITNLPKLDFEKCIGCGICITRCPGLAIFVVDKTYSEKSATVSFPYEYTPLPIKGQIVEGVNREGAVVCEGKIIRVNTAKANDCTPIVTVEVPKEMADEVRGMKKISAADVENEGNIQAIECDDDLIDCDDVIVCRCEEITVGEIKKAIEQGAEDLTGIKRRTRAGMGLCQGRTCSKIISRMLAEAKNKSMSEIKPDSSRLPIKPVEFETYGGADNEQ